MIPSSNYIRNEHNTFEQGPASVIGNHHNKIRDLAFAALSTIAGYIPESFPLMVRVSHSWNNRLSRFSSVLKIDKLRRTTSLELASSRFFKTLQESYQEIDSFVYNIFFENHHYSIFFPAKFNIEKGNLQDQKRILQTYQIPYPMLLKPKHHRLLKLELLQKDPILLLQDPTLLNLKSLLSGEIVLTQDLREPNPTHLIDKIYKMIKDINDFGVKYPATPPPYPYECTRLVNIMTTALILIKKYIKKLIIIVAMEKDRNRQAYYLEKIHDLIKTLVEFNGPFYNHNVMYFSDLFCTILEHRMPLSPKVIYEAFATIEKKGEIEEMDFSERSFWCRALLGLAEQLEKTNQQEAEEAQERALKIIDIPFSYYDYALEIFLEYVKRQREANRSEAASKALRQVQELLEIKNGITEEQNFDALEPLNLHKMSWLIRNIPKIAQEWAKANQPLEALEICNRIFKLYKIYFNQSNRLGEYSDQVVLEGFLKMIEVLLEINEDKQAEWILEEAWQYGKESMNKLKGTAYRFKIIRAWGKVKIHQFFARNTPVNKEFTRFKVNIDGIIKKMFEDLEIYREERGQQLENVIAGISVDACLKFAEAHLRQSNQMDVGEDALDEACKIAEEMMKKPGIDEESFFESVAVLYKIALEKTKRIKNQKKVQEANNILNQILKAIEERLKSIEHQKKLIQTLHLLYSVRLTNNCVF